MKKGCILLVLLTYVYHEALFKKIKQTPNTHFSVTLKFLKISYSAAQKFLEPTQDFMRRRISEYEALCCKTCLNRAL